MNNFFKQLLVTFGIFAILASGVLANDYYNHGGFPATGSPGSSAQMRAELDAIDNGFDKLPTLSGNANKPVLINGSENGMTVAAGTLTLAGNFAIAGAYSTTLTVTGATNVTLPTTGTLGTLGGAESLSLKTLVAPILSGSVTGTYTLAGTPTITAPAISSPVLSGSATGTYTLAGTPTITAPAISNPVFSGSATGIYTLAGTPTITGPAVSNPVLSGGITGTYALAGAPTVQANLLFTDATYSIGASGATRPLDLFLSRDATVGRVLTVGNTLFANNLVDISAANAGQILFPATQHPSSNANVLDDYEEGTWTPTISFGGGTTGITYTTQVGTYIKIGRVVIATFDILLSSKGSSTSSAFIGTLPFGTSTEVQPLSLIGWGNTATSYTSVTARAVEAGGTSIILYGVTGATTGSFTGLLDTNFTNTTRLQGSITYFSAQ